MSKSVSPELLLTEDEIQYAVELVAEQIAPRFIESSQENPLTVLTVLVGGFLFSSDLQTALQKRGVKTENKFVRASSYGNNKSSNQSPTFEWSNHKTAFVGKDVLVVDDLMDDGFTLMYLTTALRALGPSSQYATVLLRKEKRAQPVAVPMTAGVMIPDVWVYGYGIDSQGNFRGERDIWAEVKDEDERMLVGEFRLKLGSQLR